MLQCSHTFVLPVWTFAEKGENVMKYILLLADGMADEPILTLGNRTPLDFAETLNMDELACRSESGLVKTVPDSMKPGSDVANLSVLGYDPLKCYSGRSSLEALSVGVEMRNSDVVYRCNLVTLSENEPYEEKTIIDHSSGEISTEEADVLMDSIRQAFNNEQFSFYTGTSYREIMVWNKGKTLDLEPPHDHLGCVCGSFLPHNRMMKDMMKRSFDILNNHPINLKRAAEGKRKANSLWFWGAGTKPSLQNFAEKTGLKGAMISAVDLLKGIAVGAGMRVIEVPGANGGLHTNYEGKALAAVNAVLKEDCDFVYLHVEAPDEMGHSGSVPNKIASIENIDSRVLRPILDVMDASGEPYKLMLLPDHPTPIRCRTHTSDPVPYLIFDSTHQLKKSCRFSEKDAAASGIYEADGHLLINKFFDFGGNGK